MNAAPYWFRHEPRFNISGSTFSQPVLEGALRPEFWLDDCGSLDAPGYIGTGGIRLSTSVHDDGKVFHTEHADLDRERWGEPAPEQDDHCWAPDDDLYPYGDEVTQ